MNKGQIILVVIAVLAVVGLYNLPKVVVDNDNDNDPQSFVDESSPNGVVDHSSEIPEEAAPRIDYWKSELNIGDNLKENDSALDSLMKVYMEINKYDSAALLNCMLKNLIQSNTGKRPVMLTSKRFHSLWKSKKYVRWERRQEPLTIKC